MTKPLWYKSFRPRLYARWEVAKRIAKVSKQIEAGIVTIEELHLADAPEAEVSLAEANLDQLKQHYKSLCTRAENEYEVYRGLQEHKAKSEKLIGAMSRSAELEQAVYEAHQDITTERLV